MALVLGVVALLWPAPDLHTLIVAFGAYLLLDGIAAVIAAARSRGLWASGSVLFEGIAGTTAGILVFLFPGAWHTIVGGWAIVTGAAMLVVAALVPGPLRHESPLPVAGLLWVIAATSLALGFVVALWRDRAWPPIVWTIIAFGLLTGVSQIALTIRIRERAKQVADAPGR